jgi:hypothetical protein
VRGVEDVQSRLAVAIAHNASGTEGAADRRDALIQQMKDTHIKTLCFGPYTQPKDVAIMAERFLLLEPAEGVTPERDAFTDIVRGVHIVRI